MFTLPVIIVLVLWFGISFSVGFVISALRYRRIFERQEYEISVLASTMETYRENWLILLDTVRDMNNGQVVDAFVVNKDDTRFISRRN